ncbi:hypothetical protein COCMIDRAFT_29901 [Bipolaris oryzae ATCC 44560]|uniref:Uncharacterized protein n=1 Tax=Bipolaris oryzae ATCC 44560 TaxID=930090 RepID=W6ZC34_COCMI|nr:uncharacterized protein COCMIDRAFT_29901 [Bipolaris oryzae ATCC 44560]EUC41286.1 hypothetical protein COCMIDRAFT_29901 [Bipolaris oryzae ATCC 44560]
MYADVPGNYLALLIYGYYIKLHTTPTPKRKRTILRARCNTIIPAGTGASMAADIYFSLDHLFQSLPIPTEDEEPNDLPAGAPFIVEPPDDDTEIQRADVSKE